MATSTSLKDERVTWFGEEFTVGTLPIQLPAPGEYNIASELAGPLADKDIYSNDWVSWHCGRHRFVKILIAL